MSNVIHLGKRLDIFNLSEAENILLQHLNVDCVINLSQVESCDFSGMQMLVSFIKTLDKNGHTFSLEAPSSAFIEAIKVLGLNQQFNLMD